MADLNVFWKNKNQDAGVVGTYLTAQTMGAAMPSLVSEHSQYIQPLAEYRNGFVLKGRTYIKLSLPNGSNGFDYYVFGSEQDLVIPDARTKLDTGSTFPAGKDVYVYLVLDQTGNVPTANIVCSLNATYPQGATADTSRKIGGFHTLCLAVGTISGHPLSGLATGAILPASFWDLKHRPICGPEGMVYISELDFWKDIYLQSGTGAATKSVFGGTITNLRSQPNHEEDMFLVGKTLLSNAEFACSAEGCNQHTNIQGSAQPLTTGGHVDTAGRRMISNYGSEDDVGAYWGWLKEIFFFADMQTDGSVLAGWTDNGTYRGGNPVANISITNSRIPGYTWIQRSDDTKGQDYGMNGLIAGGNWADGALWGSRARNGHHSRLRVAVSRAGRGAGKSKAVS
jgi:hypothetical protein